VFAPAGGTVLELDGASFAPDELLAESATALLLLVGHPEPAVSIVRAVRADPRLNDVLIGAPAGQPELADWVAALGRAGAGIPFLRYLPRSPDRRVDAALRAHLGGPASFVAFEGYDTIAVLTELVHRHGTDRSAIAAGWSSVAIRGSRGTITFARVPGIDVWQWPAAPIQVVEGDPSTLKRIRILRSS